MPFANRTFAGLALLAGMLLLPPPARAAESYDNCTGFIDSLPATIATQGVWCLRDHLATAITTGAAITIATNNVTIDCNDFKLGGLAAGDASTAIGIFASGRQNATVRHCQLRGFFQGIALTGNGHVVEDSRLDNNLFMGINIEGEHNLVQRNRVLDTGGAVASNFSIGISVEGDVFDNTVAGVFANGTDIYSRGVQTYGEGGVVRGNIVRGLVASGVGNAVGIRAYSSSTAIVDNRVSAGAAISGVGVYGAAAAQTFCSGNTVANFATAFSQCLDAGGNASY